MAAAVSPPLPDRHPFLRKIDETRINKSDVNNFIMDYLITQGYPQAAERFAREAKISLNFDLEIKSQTIQDRVQIREAIHRGDLQNAIEMINELDPQLLDSNGALHFALLRLQLIELIRKIHTGLDPNATENALRFATENLASRSSTNSQWLYDFERAMSLFLFKPEDWTKQMQFQQQAQTTTSHTTSAAQSSSRQNGSTGVVTSSSAIPATLPLSTGASQPPFGALSELVDPNLRRKVAEDVNQAILRAYDRPPEAKLYHLVRTRAWAEKLARESKKIDLPDRLDIGLDGDDSSNSTVTATNGPESGQQNGHTANGSSAGAGGDTVMEHGGNAGATAASGRTRSSRRSTTTGAAARSEGETGSFGSRSAL